MGKAEVLTGFRLARWVLACHIYRLGCKVSGRHTALLEWDDDRKDWFCPHCGWIPGDEDG